MSTPNSLPDTHGEPVSGGLPRSSPESQGIPASSILAFLDAVQTKSLELHSLMVLRHGHVVAEGWWYPAAPQHPHMLFSLSKSFTSTAIGLAVGEGLISLDDPVLRFFPDDAPEEVGENLAAMRVRHLLSMSTGHAVDTVPAAFRDPGVVRNWAAAFLGEPVEHEPGTHFVYNSGATYLLSAILQRVTGTKLVDYLGPRLFEPLGIVGAKWDECPLGINTGGWGLHITTEDIARFGQLYLQDGIWNGKRILPEGWVETATKSHVSNGDDPNSDWAQGYGFQFWRCRHNAYRGDGAYGQFCVIMPDQDAVIAITSGLNDLQGVLNQIWKHLLPAMGPAALPENAEAETDFLNILEGLTLAQPEGDPESAIAPEISGRRYTFSPNEEELESVSFRFTDDACILKLVDNRGELSLTAGLAHWLKSPEGLSEAETRPAAATAVWTSWRELEVRIFFYETPFTHKLKFRFDADRVTFDRQINETFSTKDCPTIVGHV